MGLLIGFLVPADLSIGDHPDPSSDNNTLGGIAYSVSFHAAKILCPIDLRIRYPVATAAMDDWTVPAAAGFGAVVVCILANSLWSWKRCGVSSGNAMANGVRTILDTLTLLVAFAALLAPVVVFEPRDVAVDLRESYLPLMVMAPMLAVLATQTMDYCLDDWETSRVKKYSLVSFIASTFCLLGLALWFSRAEQAGWMDPQTMWRLEIDAHPDDVVGLTHSGIELRRSGTDASMQMALRMHERAAQQADPASAWTLHHWAVSLAHAGLAKEAVEHHESAVALLPTAAEIRMAFAATLQQAKRLDEAEVQMFTAVEASPRASVSLLTSFGDLHLAKAAAQEAERSFNTALESNPQFALARRGLGESAKLLAHWPEAEAHYTTAVAATPSRRSWTKQLVSLNMQVASDLLAAGKLEEAQDKYKTALGNDPRQTTALNNHGVLLHRQGRLSEAAAAFKHAIQIEGKSVSATVRANLGLTSASMQEWREADTQLKRALLVDAALAKDDRLASTIAEAQKIACVNVIAPTKWDSVRPPAPPTGTPNAEAVCATDGDALSFMGL